MQKIYQIENIPFFKGKALEWARQFDHFTMLDNNNIDYPEGAFMSMLATGCRSRISGNSQADAFAALKDFLKDRWVLGYFGYDLKNSIEQLSSRNEDKLNFPDYYFYEPETIILFNSDTIKIISEDPNLIYDTILGTRLPPVSPSSKPIHIQQKVSKEEYMQKVESIKKHIEEGDVYELNYCIEFFAEQAIINPLQVFNDLNKKSPMPFAALQRIGDNYLICASPERFLKKTGSRLVSQPIKGTARRHADPVLDKAAAQELRHSEKELAENMMIVDLVRNDLARSAVTGTVTVDEMFGIYSFRYVHQMISTVSSELRPDTHFTDAIKYAFPMGSMTGAPKIRAMEIIEELETSKRGLFSGAVGYFTPDGDFDLNVVIRSILYNNTTSYLSFSVGSAITYDALPEQEYEECFLKAAAIIDVLRKS
jgi:para-aminobenzoate synthetase component 1